MLVEASLVEWTVVVLVWSTWVGPPLAAVTLWSEISCTNQNKKMQKGHMHTYCVRTHEVSLPLFLSLSLSLSLSHTHARTHTRIHTSTHVHTKIYPTVHTPVNPVVFYRQVFHSKRVAKVLPQAFDGSVKEGRSHCTMAGLKEKLFRPPGVRLEQSHKATKKWRNQFCRNYHTTFLLFRLLEVQQSVFLSFV